MEPSKEYATYRDAMPLRDLDVRANAPLKNRHQRRADQAALDKAQRAERLKFRLACGGRVNGHSIY